MEQQIINKEILEKLNKIQQSMVTKEELSQIVETIEINSNEDTMNQIKNSESDMTKGNFKEINSTEDL
ncbi:hypothetical protein HOD75_03485 [archaeon]|jgi:hypothetical protein|nr:hypothetical protein [archaeon]MBT4241936.1 hypothetical protein [archaeon]MBT4418483.1 hypothetical protein [archaeon]